MDFSLGTASAVVHSIYDKSAWAQLPTKAAGFQLIINWKPSAHEFSLQGLPTLQFPSPYHSVAMMLLSKYTQKINVNSAINA